MRSLLPLQAMQKKTVKINPSLQFQPSVCPQQARGGCGVAVCILVIPPAASRSQDRNVGKAELSSQAQRFNCPRNTHTFHRESRDKSKIIYLKLFFLLKKYQLFLRSSEGGAAVSEQGQGDAGLVLKALLLWTEELHPTWPSLTSPRCET